MTTSDAQVKIRHGWFSQKAALHHSCGSTTYRYEYDGVHYRPNLVTVPPRGGSVYLTPDNREVVVTNVTDTKELVNYHWDDTVYVCEVTSWVRDAPPIVETIKKTAV